MTPEQIQELCERGQAELMATRYIEAERLLVEAEAVAWAARDWDSLARLYMPLQEARRQRRQRCGEGMVRLDLLASGPAEVLSAGGIIRDYPFGQLLVAGWGTIAPALEVRRIAWEQGLFVETFLGAAYPTTQGLHVAIVPLEAPLPAPTVHAPADLLQRLPSNSLLCKADELPPGTRPGTPATYGQVMGMWERLAGPFLAAADAEKDPITRMEGYRTTIRVDYGCELAHQRLADAARGIGRMRAARRP